MDGFAGRFFIRQPPEEEPHSKLYDYDLTEHSILVQQFVHRVDRKIILMITLKLLADPSL